MMSKYTIVVYALKKVKDQSLLYFCSIEFTLDFCGLCKESQLGQRALLRQKQVCLVLKQIPQEFLKSLKSK